MPRTPPQMPLWRILGPTGDVLGRHVPAESEEGAVRKFLELSPYWDNGTPLRAIRGTH